MKISFYKENENNLFLKVNYHFYQININNYIISSVNENAKYKYLKLKKIDMYEIVFNQRLINKIIANIINTLEFNEDFNLKFVNEGFSLNFIKEDDQKDIKEIYQELIKYADLTLFHKKFINKKEKIEKKYKLLEKQN